MNAEEKKRLEGQERLRQQINQAVNARVAYLESHINTLHARVTHALAELEYLKDKEAQRSTTSES